LGAERTADLTLGPAPADKVRMDRRSLIAFLADERGQGLAEYALIIALVVMVAIAALRIVGAKAKNTLNNVAGDLS
jgi:pilus assembly protein Flp/PilA